MSFGNRWEIVETPSFIASAQEWEHIPLIGGVVYAAKWAVSQRPQFYKRIAETSSLRIVPLDGFEYASGIPGRAHVYYIFEEPRGPIKLVGMDVFAQPF